jgi:hypothetical protein
MDKVDKVHLRNKFIHTMTLISKQSISTKIICMMERGLFGRPEFWEMADFF